MHMCRIRLSWSVNPKPVLSFVSDKELKAAQHLKDSRRIILLTNLLQLTLHPISVNRILRYHRVVQIDIRITEAHTLRYFLHLYDEVLRLGNDLVVVVGVVPRNADEQVEEIAIRHAETPLPTADSRMMTCGCGWKLML